MNDTIETKQPDQPQSKLRCPNCGKTESIVGVEYRHPHPESYDGVSNWQCLCGTRWGRWSGKILLGEAYERRYGQ